MAIVLLLQPLLATADFIVPANATINLNGGTLDLGCSDLIIAGTLQLGSGQVLNTRNVIVRTGGALNGGSGVIELGGDWSNDGQFFAETGTVQFRDLCAISSASISGNSVFANLRLVSSIGKEFVFAAGTTQKITDLLEITGTEAQPIQLRSSVPGSPAYIDLAGDATQQISHVGVTDVWATGQALAPGQDNEGGAGNAGGWFDTRIPIPALSNLMLIMLAALLALAAKFRLHGGAQPARSVDAGRRRRVRKGRS